MPRIRALGPFPFTKNQMFANTEDTCDQLQVSPYAQREQELEVRHPTRDASVAYTLPVELLMCIFQYVAQVKRVLHQIASQSTIELEDWQRAAIIACTLVCKAWRQAALPFFFNVATKYVTSWNSKHGSFPAFVLSLDEFSNVSRHVRNMVLRHEKDFDLSAFLMTVLPRMPSLRRLEMSSLCMPPIPDLQHLHVAMPTLLNLDFLELCQLSWSTSAQNGPHPTYSPRSVILRTLPVSQVGHLRVQGFEREDDDEGDAAGATGTRPRQLHAVVIHRIELLDATATAPVILQALSDIVQPGTLRSVIVRCNRRENLAGLCSLLRGAGANVTYLDIRLTRFMEAEQWESLNGNNYEGPWAMIEDTVSACPKLEKLRIHVLPYAIEVFFSGELPFPGRDRYPLFASIVNALPRSVREFRVFLHTRWDSPIWSDKLQLWDLDALEALSDKRRFPHFERVLVQTMLPDSGYESDAETAVDRGVKACLPRLHDTEQVHYSYH